MCDLLFFDYNIYPLYFISQTFWVDKTVSSEKNVKKALYADRSLVYYNWPDPWSYPHPLKFSLEQ